MKVKLFESEVEAKKHLNNNVPRLVIANGISLCIILIEDKVIAFRNKCPHLGHTLHSGNVNYLNEIVCPLHTYRFNLKTGEEAEQRCGSLHFHKVLNLKNGIWLEMN